jgi:AcrR family transcriptional regulator
MAKDVNPPGPVRPRLREEQAAATRHRVFAAARTLFEANGYAATTVNDVAAAARVSAETIYKSIGGKSGLLDGIIEEAIAGPEQLPLEEQDEHRNIAGLATPEERLRAYVAFCCGVLERTKPVHKILRSAADTEPRAAEVRVRQQRTRLVRNTSRLDEFIGPALRSGLTLEQAAHHFYALSSPELYELLTTQLRWSKQRHRQWLADIAVRELLGHAPTHRTEPTDPAEESGLELVEE